MGKLTILEGGVGIIDGGARVIIGGSRGGRQPEYKKQEAHGPHRSPEKTVQIKHILLYHNVD